MGDDGGGTAVCDERVRGVRTSDPRAASLRRLTFEALEPRARTKGLSAANILIATLILVAGACAILETEPTLARFGGTFAIVELGLGAIFSLEYLARLWIAPESELERPWRARLRFVLSAGGLTDLLAILSSLAFVGGSSALLLRLVRLARIVRLAKLGRMSRAMDHMIDAISSRRDELLLSLLAGVVLLVVAATGLYLAEGGAQPDKFGSIPRALWWAVATMTTVGYGDVYPVTVAGKVLAGLVAVVSIGIIAMPTGILAAAFSDAMERHRRSSADRQARP